MLEITLMKTLYNEMDPDKIAAVHEFDDERHSKYRELFIDVPGFPDIKTMIMEMEYLSHNATMYYLHFNGNLEEKADIHTDAAKAVILTFFKTYQPSFFLEDLPEDISDISILDCFDVAKIPDYRPKYAFPGIVMLEDIKNGKVKLNDPAMPSFPGLRMFGENKKKDNRPAYVSNSEKFTQFNGDNDDFQKKMDELKKQFDIDSLMGNK